MGENKILFFGKGIDCIVGGAGASQTLVSLNISVLETLQTDKGVYLVAVNALFQIFKFCIGNAL